MKKIKFSKLYLIIVIVLIYIPIILAVLYSFNESKISSIWGGFSLKWYGELFKDEAIWEALVNSIIIATTSSLAGMLIGLTGAYGAVKGRWTKIDKFTEKAVLLPMMIPEIILGMVFLTMFSALNLKFGLLTLFLSHTAFTIPYNYMLIRARLEERTIHLENAARDLGASSWQVFKDIILPFLQPAMISGLILSFAMSFDDVVISVFVTGATVNTLPVKIYSMIKTGVTPKINALSAILVAVIVIAVLINKIVNNKKERKTI